MGINIKSKILISLGVIVLLGISGIFGYNLYNKTRPDFKNIAYSEISKNNILDTYIPKVGKAPYPVVIWIHGGAFKMGSKANPQSLDRLLSEGFAVVSINYRLSSEAIWPAQLTDLQNVVKFIKTNGEKYSLNTEKIGSWGASAGGYLSSMMGIALSSDPETKIQATVDWFGPVDFFTMDEDIEKTKIERKTGKNGDADSPESALLGKTVKENKEIAYRSSPLSYIESLMIPPPPFLIMHGEVDPMIGYPQSERLRNALMKKFGNPIVEYYLLPNGDHGGGDFQKKETEDIVINFLKKHLN